MSSDDPPPRPARPSRGLLLLVAVLALLGVALGVLGADTTVTDAAGAAPIVDDASRQDPAQYEQSSHEEVDAGPASRRDPVTQALAQQCRTSAGGPRVADGCIPATRRGPPGA